MHLQCASPWPRRGSGTLRRCSDLATYAKAVGGGFPLSVLAGSAEIMDRIANGIVVHAGTLNGNPLALAAAQATLTTLAANNGAVYEQLWANGERLRTGIAAALTGAGHRVVTSGGGPVFHVSFMEKPARTYRETLSANMAALANLGWHYWTKEYWCCLTDAGTHPQHIQRTISMRRLRR